MQGNDSHVEARKFRRSLLFTLAFTSILWLVKGMEEWAVGDLGYLGILPRTLHGTFGIVTAPLIHGDLTHLLSNTFPLILLGVGVFYFYDKIALEVFGWIYLTTGFWVWLAARGDAYHIGASGIVYGLMGFLFFSGVFRRDVRGVAISLAVLFLYGGMILGMSPGNPEISYESHILGMLAGAFCAFHFRKANSEPLVPSSDEEENVTALSHSLSSASEAPTYRFVYTSEAREETSDKPQDTPETTMYHYTLTEGYPIFKYPNNEQDPPSESKS
ncbi:rhomboid family intramembrane serine protease [Roseivirga sp. BDSF3-8]|uniref:rhomboid family intramembrane serine protease n=1 Tax=Roseivirga sp. BDSF3-8 TaxID=3241598 RepID=UPI0035319931